MGARVLGELHRDVLMSLQAQSTTSPQDNQQPINANISAPHEQIPECNAVQCTNTEPGPYSVFSSSQKWAIVILATFAGLFSPLGSSIYFPAIPSLAKAFYRSTQDIK
jgi:hypothetical protein